MSKQGSAFDVNLEDRDPKNLNQHLQIVWDDIVGEPDSARTPESAWRVSKLVFNRTRNCCYTVLTVLLSVPSAICLGFCFACLLFEQIWCSAPYLQVMKILCASTRTFVRALVAAFVTPVAESIGYACSRIRIEQKQDERNESDILNV